RSLGHPNSIFKRFLMTVIRKCHLEVIVIQGPTSLTTDGFFLMTDLGLGYQKKHFLGRVEQRQNPVLLTRF
ncbi:MAG: hypothetical protein K6B45_09490, partial [Bacteroidaceae bacterium]|nr:hypothetical protein [Bacteroidaceae bacterium]